MLVRSLELVVRIRIIILYYNHHLSFNEKTIIVSNNYGKINSIDWDQIKDIKFNAFAGTITIKSNNGIVIKIHQYIVGLKRFTDMIEKKTAWTAKELRIPVNDQFRLN
ncbi:hypothetical protein [Chondrinema litorale]|uniref:hypothetical protein n=1 Tax=Chondrinema litorale TaxID=2994555 RepID=UPI0025434656|nr:hypothetical protein [Chondrinema litorale]UZR97852.1 hypothetical protein OQ292_28980 [Chondrinema litorale]